jgi:hypothetical protein
VYDPADPSRAYYGTDSRAHMLLIGCLLAVGLMRWGPRAATTRTAVDVAGAIGIAYCVWAWASIHDTSAWMYYGGYAVFGVAVAAVITSAVQPGNGPLRVALSVRPAVWVGRISYGLYLWHWPVIVVMTPALPGSAGGARCPHPVTVASRCVVLPRRLPIRRGVSAPVALALPTAFVGAGVAVLVATAGAAPLPAYLGAAGQVVTAPGEHRGDVSNATTGGTTTSAPGRVMVVGDSLAVSLAPGLAQAGAVNGIQVSSRAFSGCGLITGAPLDPKGKLYPWSKECSDAIPRHEVDAVHETQPNLVLWLSGAWDARDRTIGGNTVRIGTASGDRVVLQLIDDAARRLTAGGSSLAIVIPAPDAPGSQLAADPRRNKRLGHLNRLLREYAASHGIEVAELAPIVCPHGEPCPRVLNGIRLRPDGYHFSSKASRWVADRLLSGLLPSLSSTGANADRAGVQCSHEAAGTRITGRTDKDSVQHSYTFRLVESPQRRAGGGIRGRCGRTRPPRRTDTESGGAHAPSGRHDITPASLRHHRARRAPGHRSSSPSRAVAPAVASAVVWHGRRCASGTSGAAIHH